MARNGTAVNRQWDGIWNARVARSEIGWTIEIEIPFRRSLRSERTSWGINFQRTVRRKNEETLWSGWARNQGLTPHVERRAAARPRRASPRASGWK